MTIPAPHQVRLWQVHDGIDWSVCEDFVVLPVLPIPLLIALECIQRSPCCRLVSVEGRRQSQQQQQQQQPLQLPQPEQPSQQQRNFTATPDSTGTSGNSNINSNTSINNSSGNSNRNISIMYGGHGGSGNYLGFDMVQDDAGAQEGGAATAAEEYKDGDDNGPRIRMYPLNRVENFKTLPLALWTEVVGGFLADSDISKGFSVSRAACQVMSGVVAQQSQWNVVAAILAQDPKAAEVRKQVFFIAKECADREKCLLHPLNQVSRHFFAFTAIRYHIHTPTMPPTHTTPHTHTTHITHHHTPSHYITRHTRFALATATSFLGTSPSPRVRLSGCWMRW